MPQEEAKQQGSHTDVLLASALNNCTPTFLVLQDSLDTNMARDNVSSEEPCPDVQNFLTGCGDLSELWQNIG